MQQQARLLTFLILISGQVVAPVSTAPPRLAELGGSGRQPQITFPDPTRTKVRKPYFDSSAAA